MLKGVSKGSEKQNMKFIGFKENEMEIQAESGRRKDKSVPERVS